jgi:hypothetical protein
LEAHNSFVGKFKAGEGAEEFCHKNLSDLYVRPYHSWNAVARVLSLPENADEFRCGYVDSYRTCNGILHSPSKDKRTRKDVFHIVKGGSIVPSDKKEVSKVIFAKMLQMAFKPNDKMLAVPFISNGSNSATLFGFNHMTPMSCPRIEDIQEEKGWKYGSLPPETWLASWTVQKVFLVMPDPHCYQKVMSLWIQ